MSDNHTPTRTDQERNVTDPHSGQGSVRPRGDAYVFVANLRAHQEQLDPDGVMVGVSRQALDEALALIDRLTLASLHVRGLRRVLVEADGVMAFIKSTARHHYGSCETDDICAAASLIKAAIIDADDMLARLEKGSVEHQIEMAVVRTTLNQAVIPTEEWGVSPALRGRLDQLSGALREDARVAAANNYRYESRDGAEESLSLADEIDALPSAAWLPIDSAPKDGTWVLISPGLHQVPVVASWVRERGWFGFWRLPMTAQDARSPYQPTHWMRLPALPDHLRGA